MLWELSSARTTPLGHCTHARSLTVGHVVVVCSPEVFHREVGVLKDMLKYIARNLWPAIGKRYDDTPMTPGFLSQENPTISDAIDLVAETLKQDIEGIFGFDVLHSGQLCSHVNRNAESRSAIQSGSVPNPRRLRTLQNIIVGFNHPHHRSKGIVERFTMSSHRQLATVCPPTIAVFLRTPSKCFDHRVTIVPYRQAAFLTQTRELVASACAWSTITESIA